jgi:hypothetical protein
MALQIATAQTLFKLHPFLAGYRFECSQCASFSKPTMLEQGIPQTERLTNPSSHLPQDHSPATPQNDTGNVLQSRPYDHFANKFQEPRKPGTRNPFQASIGRPRAPSKSKLPKPPKAPKPPRIEKPQREPPVPLDFKHLKWKEMMQTLKADVIVHAQYFPFHQNLTCRNAVTCTITRTLSLKMPRTSSRHATRETVPPIVKKSRQKCASKSELYTVTISVSIPSLINLTTSTNPGKQSGSIAHNATKPTKIPAKEQ